MKNGIAPEYQTTRRILPIACATAVAAAFTVSLPQAAHAHEIAPPPVPTDIQVKAGQEAFLVGHAVGTQNYICLPCGVGTQNPTCPPSSPGFAWILFTPQATLYNDSAKQIATHFFSPNPFENGTPVRAAWQHSRDTSIVWGQVTGSSSDANFVKKGAIPWLRVERVGSQDGPTGGDTLTATKSIQRVNTDGGSAPSNGCAALGDVDKKAFVPYRADYFFYFNPDEDDRH